MAVFCLLPYPSVIWRIFDKCVGGFFFNMFVVQEVHVNGGGGHHGDHQEAASMDNMEDMDWKPQVSFLSKHISTFLH